MSHFSSKAIKRLTASDFDSNTPTKLKSGASGMVIYFVNWCVHCAHLSPVIETLASSMTDFTFMAMECSDNQEQVQKMNNHLKESNKGAFIQGYPTIYFYKNGKPVREYTSERTEPALKKAVRSFMNS